MLVKEERIILDLISETHPSCQVQSGLPSFAVFRMFYVHHFVFFFWDCSGRIGRLEDEEDMARERASLKRKKQTSHKPTKQTKLSF